MLTYTVWLVTGVLFAMAVPVQAELLRLEPQGEWHPAVTDVPEATHPGLAQVHAAMASADSDAVVTALEAIQRDYPELAGGDLTLFWPPNASTPAKTRQGGPAGRVEMAIVG